MKVHHGSAGVFVYMFVCWSLCSCLGCVCVYTCICAIDVCIHVHIYIYISIHIYIYKQELKTVVHELLACTQPYSHETFTALGTPTVECPRGGNMRKYTSAE